MLTTLFRITFIILCFWFVVVGFINLFRSRYWPFVLFIVANLLGSVPFIVRFIYQYDKNPDWAMFCLWIGAFCLSFFMSRYIEELRRRGLTLWTIFFGVKGKSRYVDQ